MKAYYNLTTWIFVLFLWNFPTINLSACNGNSINQLACTEATCAMHHAAQGLEFGAKMGKYIKQKQFSEAAYQIKTVVIDPGHGGYDSGCLGAGSQEKHLALKISKQVKKQLEAQYPGVQVLMTRYSDVFIPLHKRAAIANKAKADLFISIHCNALSASKVTKGTETYVLGLHKADENLKVAKRENASVLLEDNYENNYDFDPNSDQGHIMLSMYQNAFLEQSISFAEKVEKNMASVAKRRSRGVKQAGFLVLHQTTMPSVLVETGFLTNAIDEKYLKTENGQRQIAASILKAFSEYKREVEKTETTFIASAPSKNTRNSAKKPSRSSTKTTAPSKATKPVKKVVVEEPFPEEPVSRKRGPVQFRVQLAASPKEIDMRGGKWENSLYLIEVLKEDGLFKYQARNFHSLEEANQAKQILKQRGFTDAFVVAYQAGTRIKMSEATELMKN
jgi:N-acetylmuramoyl-L-alanine amidase